jgi:hypothetical protein
MRTFVAHEWRQKWKPIILPRRWRSLVTPRGPVCNSLAAALLFFWLRLISTMGPRPECCTYLHIYCYIYIHIYCYIYFYVGNCVGPRITSFSLHVGGGKQPRPPVSSVDRESLKLAWRVAARTYLLHVTAEDSGVWELLQRLSSSADKPSVPHNPGSDRRCDSASCKRNTESRWVNFQVSMWDRW